MQITTTAIINGEFADQYGKRGSQCSENGMPTYSIPFEISGVPQGTQSFTVVLENKASRSLHSHKPRALPCHTSYLRATQTLRLRCRVCAVRTHAVFVATE